MKNARDDFSSLVKEILAKRVGYLCSNCKQPTIGANEAPTKSTSIGVAAHITAAAPGGMRYSKNLLPEERSDINNGIWLCSNCATLIDKDPDKFTIDILYEIKLQAEEESRQRLNPNRITKSKNQSPILEVDLSGWGRSRIPGNYSLKNPIEEHEGQWVLVVGNKPIIHWTLNWRYKLSIINNSSYPAFNVKIESIGAFDFFDIPKLNSVNNIPPLQRIEFDVKFTDWIESDHSEADRILESHYPKKFEDLQLKVVYKDEERKEYETLVKFVNGTIINEKL